MNTHPTPKKTEILEDYTAVAEGDAEMTGFTPEAPYYSDVKKREWYDFDSLQKFKQHQDNVIAAEQARDSQAVIDAATAEKEWVEPIL